jgi:hypothetical protein
MKKRPKQLEISVSDLSDIRLLVNTWRQVLFLAGRDPAEVILVYVTVEDRVPGEEVRLIFQEYPEILEGFLKAIEDQGCKVVCEELIPGICSVGRMERIRGN